MTTWCGQIRRIRIQLAAALYELALWVAPADVADEVQDIVANGKEIGLARLEIEALDRALPWLA